MSEEKKVYSVVGKVEIGTDEYRDLIEGVVAAKADAEAQVRRWCDEYSRANKLEKELKDAKEKLERLLDFVNSSEEIRTKYKMYLLEREESDK